MSATERRARREAREAGTTLVETGEVFRGILVRPAPGGGWHHREVAIPTHIVELYATHRAPTPDLKPRIVERITRWLANPDMLRMVWR